MTRSPITSVMAEARVFPPPAAFAAQARVDSMAAYRELYDAAAADPEGYWAAVAKELWWAEPWTHVGATAFTNTSWFTGGKTNLAVNCVDRHLASWRRNKAAILWEGEPGDTRIITYQELHRDVCKAANAMAALGVTAGDFVAIYMPMVPEAAIAMLACARLGAPHTVVFGGFSAESLADRLRDSQATLVITADGGWRRGQAAALKTQVDQAVPGTKVRRVLVVRRTGQPVDWDPTRDVWWHDAVEHAAATHDAQAFDAEHPLFSLYTSGTTGKPKGILHTTAGYMVGVYQSTRLVFDLRDDDVFWCTADVGWITGHSYIVYGPLANGATLLMYEGAPNQPTLDRFWHMIERWRVSIFYTAPTAIRSFMRWGDEYPAKHDLSSLRLLGSVGEPINPAAWTWYHEVIGQRRCPIVDTWWQTETGAIMIAPLPGATPTKPGSATLPLPGVVVDVVHKDGTPCVTNEGGFLVIRQPWPSMARTIYGDHARYEATYFAEIPGVYFAGDGARRDADGYLWIMGRVDDVINVSGHRLSTMEIESALVAHPSVAEAAVVGRPDEVKGQAIVAFVTPKAGIAKTDALAEAIRQHVAHQIGALARPEELRFADALPKTRSGKIMRRLLRDLASGTKTTGDVTTLEDQTVLNRLAQAMADDE